MPNAGVGACPSDMEIDHNIFGTVLAVSRVSPMAPRHFPFISKGIFTLTSALIYSLFPCCAVVSGGPNSRPPRKYFVLFKPFLLSARAHISLSHLIQGNFPPYLASSDSLHTYCVRLPCILQFWEMEILSWIVSGEFSIFGLPPRTSATGCSRLLPWSL